MTNSDLMKPSAHQQLVNGWAEWMDKKIKGGDMATETAKAYRAGLTRYAEFVQFVPRVNTVVVQEFVDTMKQTHATATVGLWLSGVKSFYRWAVMYEHMPRNPAEGVSAGKRENANKAHTREPIGEDEALRLLGLELPPRDSAIIALMLYCAMRGIAIRRADYQDLGTKGGKRILYTQEKGRKTKTEYKVIPRTALLKLNAWLKIRGNHRGPLFESQSRRSKGSRLAASSLREIIGKAFDKAQIFGKEGTAAGKSHRLRHTAITTLLRSGGSLRQAQTIAGHSDPKTTMIYAHEIDRTENAPEDLIDYGEG